MTQTQMDSFSQNLEAARSELRGKESTNWDRIITSAAPDEMDRLQNASDRDYAINNLERNSKRLTELTDALGRIRAGSFGECAECEEPIAPRRLAAIPWAVLCITCQEAADRERLSPSGRSERELLVAA